MDKKRQFFIRLFILLFTVSVSVTVIPSSGLYILGLFGEVKSSTVTEDNDFREESGKQVYANHRKHKGINVFNIWFELWCCIVYMIFIMYQEKLPRGHTMVTLKVRMDN